MAPANVRELCVAVSGYEGRCTEWARKTGLASWRQWVVLGFKELRNVLSRPESDRFYAEQRLEIIDFSRDDSDGVISFVVAAIQRSLAADAPLHVHIDYSCMPRKWYCKLPLAIEQVLRARDKAFFWYTAGNYSVGEYPTAGVSDFQVFAGRASLSATSRTHVFGLGFDKIRANAICSVLDPQYLICFYANPHGAVEPLIKWPGGKRWIAPLISRLVRVSLRRTYFEPFLGSGAVFFQLASPKSVLSDVNGELIGALKTLRDEPEAVLNGLRRLSNTAACYYEVRARLPKTRVGGAVRFIYLTRTCWGGIYRLNRSGEFNVPFGDSGRVICRKANLMTAALALRQSRLRVSDFEDVINSARDGDVVYADPPYTTLGENNGFLRYNERLFAWADQVRLAQCCRRIHRAGATAIISGLCHESVLSLYPGWWAIKVARHSTVSRLSSGHRTVTEVVITNRKPAVPFGVACVGIERIPGSATEHVPDASGRRPANRISEERMQFRPLSSSWCE